MKKNKRIWIPLIVILGVILIPVVLVIVFIFGMTTYGQIRTAMTERQLTKYVNKNYQEIEEMSEELLAKYAGKDLPLFVGENGYMTMIESPDERILSIEIGEDENGHGTVRYGFRFTGNVVSGRSYYIIYSSDDDIFESITDSLSLEYETEKTGANELTWHEVGDNGGMIRKIRDKFYLLEEWC